MVFNLVSWEFLKSSVWFDVRPLEFGSVRDRKKWFVYISSVPWQPSFLPLEREVGFGALGFGGLAEGDERKNQLTKKREKRKRERREEEASGGRRARDTERG